MVRRCVESDEIFDSNSYRNTRMIDYIVEFVEVLEDLTEEQLEDAQLTKAIEVVYRAVEELEGPIARVTA